MWWESIRLRAWLCDADEVSAWRISGVVWTSHDTMNERLLTLADSMARKCIPSCGNRMASISPGPSLRWASEWGAPTIQHRP